LHFEHKKGFPELVYVVWVLVVIIWWIVNTLLKNTWLLLYKNSPESIYSIMKTGSLCFRFLSCKLHLIRRFSSLTW
jgi:hypothetical protein